MDWKKILEDITNSTSVTGSVTTMLGWIVNILRESQQTAAPSVAKQAVEQHAAQLEEHAHELAAAVVANTAAAGEHSHEPPPPPPPPAAAPEHEADQPA